MNNNMGSGSTRKASIKETGEELPQEDWARFDAAVDELRAERARHAERLHDFKEWRRDQEWRGR